MAPAVDLDGMAIYTPSMPFIRPSRSKPVAHPLPLPTPPAPEAPPPVRPLHPLHGSAPPRAPLPSPLHLQHPLPPRPAVAAASPLPHAPPAPAAGRACSRPPEAPRNPFDLALAAGSEIELLDLTGFGSLAEAPSEQRLSPQPSDTPDVNSCSEPLPTGNSRDTGSPVVPESPTAVSQFSAVGSDSTAVGSQQENPVVVEDLDPLVAVCARLGDYVDIPRTPSPTAEDASSGCLAKEEPSPTSAPPPLPRRQPARVVVEVPSIRELSSDGVPRSTLARQQAIKPRGSPARRARDSAADHASRNSSGGEDDSDYTDGEGDEDDQGHRRLASRSLKRRRNLAPASTAPNSAPSSSNPRVPEGDILMFASTVAACLVKLLSTPSPAQGIDGAAGGGDAGYNGCAAEHRGGKRGRWSKNEDKLLLSLVRKDSPPTEDDVEGLFPSRTLSSVQQRYRVFQKRQEEEGRKQAGDRERKPCMSPTRVSSTVGPSAAEERAAKTSQPRSLALAASLRPAPEPAETFKAATTVVTTDTMAGTSLRDLPPEILTLILEELPDLYSLRSAVQGLAPPDTWADLNRIARLIFLRTCREAEKHHKYGTIVRELLFAAHDDMLGGNTARGLLEEGWNVLKQRGLEELLIPVGMAVARRLPFVEALRLLVAIYNGADPFGWSDQPLGKGPSGSNRTRERLPAIYPLARLAVRLQSDAGRDATFFKAVAARLEPHYADSTFALIEGGDVRLFTELGRICPASLSSDGIFRLHGEDRVDLHTRWDTMPLVVKVGRPPRPLPLEYNLLASLGRQGTH